MPWADRILILDQHNRRLDDEENHFLFPAALSVLCFYDSLFHLHYLSPSVCVQMWPSGLLEWSPRVMRVSDLINWDVRRAQFTLVVHQPTLMYFLKNKNIFIGGVNISSMCVLIKGLRKSVLCGGFHAENLILVRWSSSQRGDNKTSSSSPLAQNLIVVIIMFIVIAKIR